MGFEENASIHELRRYLADLFQQCTSRQELISKMKEESEQLEELDAENAEMEAEIKKLRDKIKDALLIREKKKNSIGHIHKQK